MNIELIVPCARQMFEESVRCKTVIDHGSVPKHHNHGLV